MIITEVRNQNILSLTGNFPRVLLDQRLSEISSCCIKQDDELEVTLKPSLRRFYGVLACIDISGFTKLSTLLDIDDFINHIAIYFGEIISIIENWSGDIIKFAGDSIYVLWRQNSSIIDRNSFGGIFSALQLSLSCLAEVHDKCGRYEISYKRKEDTSFEPGVEFLNVQSQLSSPINSPTIVEHQLSTKYILTVHSGISAGVIGGCDVGCLDRWEYLMLGEPVIQVGQALSFAAKGCIVITNTFRNIITKFI